MIFQGRYENTSIDILSWRLIRFYRICYNPRFHMTKYFIILIIFLLKVHLYKGIGKIPPNKQQPPLDVSEFSLPITLVCVHFTAIHCGYQIIENLSLAVVNMSDKHLLNIIITLTLLTKNNYPGGVFTYSRVRGDKTTTSAV